MNNWFECKVKYEKIDQNSGKTKKVIEPYLIDAVSFSEAEKRIYEELENLISGVFTVKSINKANYTDVFDYEDGFVWFKGIVCYTDVCEESGKDKKVKNNMLVTANTPREAYDRIQESLKDMVVSYDITTIQQSPIVDIFPYDPNKVPSNLKPVEGTARPIEAGKDFEGIV